MATGKFSGSSRRRKKAVDEPTLLSLLWPIVLGVMVTFLTIRLAGVLVLMGREQFACLYPWVALVRNPILGIDYGSAYAMSQVLLYFQFPAYGLLAGSVLYASNSGAKAFFSVATLHLLALCLFIALTIFFPG